MFVIKRNQVVVTALAVMIAAAGYLNFQESRSSEGKQTALQLTEEGDVTALVDYSALPDDADETELDPITAETTGDGAAVYVSANGNGSAYFAEAKLNREQSRAKEKDILTEMLNNEMKDFLENEDKYYRGAEGKMHRKHAAIAGADGKGKCRRGDDPIQGVQTGVCPHG